MDRMLNDYLKRIDRRLKSLETSERIDIVKEIKSEMLGLERDGFSPEQIVARLGAPDDMAKAYLGEAISKGKGLSWRRFKEVAAFYSLAGLEGMFILSMTSICALTFTGGGVLAITMGLVRFIAHLAGFEIHQIGLTIGSYTGGAAEVMIAARIMGVLLLISGRMLWKLTLSLIRSMSRGKKKLGRVWLE